MVMYAAFFSVWVIFSFLAHSLAKYYFQFVSRLCDGDSVTMTAAAVLVTGVQLLSCGVLALVKSDATKDDKPSLGVLFMVAIPHAFGALMTNYSMALIPASSTHLIKVMEPMVTAGIAWLAVGVTVSKPKLLALLLVLIGAVGATWDPFNTSRIHGLGVQLALFSNLLYATRNVTIKHLLGRSVVFEAAAMGKVSLLGAIIFLPFCVVVCMSIVSHSILHFDLVMVAVLVGSAFCHATYTYISTCVILQYITVIGHAVANVGKRVLVIVLLYLFGRSYYLSPTFVVVCVLGLLVYTKSSQDAAHQTSLSSHAGKADPSLRKHRVVIVVIIVVTVVLVTLGIIASTVPEHVTRRPVDQPNNTDSTMKSKLNASSAVQEAQKIHTVPEYVTRRLVDQPNNTDSTMKSKLNASSAIKEAQKIQLQIYKELIGHYKKAILVGLGDHENSGDSAITVGEFEALNKLGIDVVYYCSMYKCNFEMAKEIIRRAKEPVVVLTSGGGNFCTWKSGCDFREKLVRALPDQKVLVFPQSVSFENTQKMEAHAGIMNTHANITYLFRDHKSYNIIVNSGMFRYDKAVLCPDAAMQIGMQHPPIEPTHDIVWLKRKDKESLNSKLPRFPANLSIVVGDWIDTITPRGKNLKETSYKRLMTGFKFLSRGKVIISDRLHAHILSVLLGKPNVILDNPVYQKVTSFHNTWTPSVGNVLVASNVTDAIEKAQDLLHKYY